MHESLPFDVLSWDAWRVRGKRGRSEGAVCHYDLALEKYAKGRTNG